MKKMKSIPLVGIIALTVVVSGVYLFENSYTSVSYGSAQYSDLPFEWSLDEHDIIAVATISNTEMVTFERDETDNYANGTEYVFETSKIPFLKVTLDVDRYFKDTTGNFERILTVYEMSTDGIGEINGERVKYYKPHPQEYAIGDKHFYLLEPNNDIGGELFLDGFYSRHEIITELNGIQYIQSPKNEMFGHDPILYLDAIADSIKYADEDMTLKMIEVRDRLLSESDQ